MIAARWRAGLSRSDAAGRLGVSVETYIGWESGTGVPPRRDRPAVASVLGVRLVDVDGWLESGLDDPYRIGRPR
ncbi:MAG: helix-turn-helix transcriptional regulator [Pseudonocardia sp.]|nr:helix-turn-helix transcriptional regulator [Pseudonocardia sp.]